MILDIALKDDNQAYGQVLTGEVTFRDATENDRVLGFIASSGDRDLLTVETSRGAEQTISTAKYEITSRGGEGRAAPAAAVHPHRPAAARRAGAVHGVRLV